MTTFAIGIAHSAALFLAAALQAPSDTTKKPAQLGDITVTAAPARRDEPSGGLRLVPAVIHGAAALNPYQLLREAAGFEVHDQGQGPGFASNASVRGFSSDHSTDVALWVDGVPNNEPVNGHAEGYNDWNLLFPQAIQSVEIFKGPTNPLYGNFALAGAVSIRTLERMRGARGTLSAGGYGRVDGSLMAGFDRDEAGGIFGLRAVREDGWRPHSGFRQAQGHGRLDRNLSSSATLDAGAELYAAGWDSPGFLSLDQFDQRDYRHVSDRTDGGFKRRAQERVSLRVVGSGALLWRSTIYATQGRWQLFLTTPPEGGTTEGSGSQIEEEDRRYGFGMTSALTWAGTKSELTLGIEGRGDHSDYENWFTTGRRRDSATAVVAARQLSGALILQSSFAPASWIKASIGARYEVRNAGSTPEGVPGASDTRGVFLPKLGVLLRWSGPIAGYVNASRGFRQTDGVIYDPTLPFITSWAYEAGVKGDWSRVHASVALFRMDVSNEQSFDPITLRSTSGGASRHQGIEVDLTAEVGRGFSLATDWTLNDARYRRLVTEEGDTLSGGRVFNTARFVGSGRIDYAPSGARWDIGGGVNVVGPYTPFDAAGVTLPTYALFHLHGSYHIGRTNLSLGFRNLLNRAYPEIRAGEFVAPGQPRSVYGGVEYRF